MHTRTTITFGGKVISSDEITEESLIYALNAAHAIMNGTEVWSSLKLYKKSGAGFINVMLSKLQPEDIQINVEIVPDALVIKLD